MFRIVALLNLLARRIPLQIALYQSHSCALHRHISSGPHRNPDMCLCKGRSVIDTVSCHGYNLSLRLEFFDNLCLLVRQDPAITSSMPSFFPTASAVVLLSPVSITTLIPS